MQIVLQVKMFKKMCRLCLSTENIMFPLDESFVCDYNLLTNLHVSVVILFSINIGYRKMKCMSKPTSNTTLQKALC